MALVALAVLVAAPVGPIVLALLAAHLPYHLQLLDDDLERRVLAQDQPEEGLRPPQGQGQHPANQTLLAVARSSGPVAVLVAPQAAAVARRLALALNLRFFSLRELVAVP